MTKSEFESAYAKRSRISLQKLRAFPRRAYPCHCDDYSCEGWQMVNPLLYWEDRGYFADSLREKFRCSLVLMLWRIRTWRWRG